MISVAQSNNSFQLALLHYQSSNQDFLPKLGLSFLSSLYSHLISKELVLVYKEEGKVLGFVCCAISSSGIMKRFVLSSPVGVLKIILAILKKPMLVKPIWETFRAPSLSNSDNKEDIPETELLSIYVIPEAQQRGIGCKLLTELENEFNNRNITRYKVIAGEKLKGANNFYRKNGFQLVKQISIHGNNISNVYIKNITF